MTITTTKSAYWNGVRDGAPFILMVAPFAALFGVVSIEAGLNLFETLSFSFVVIAGAAQFTALELMQKEAPTFIVLISALAVNLRVAMYSAALTPYLGKAPLWQRVLMSYMLVDQSYALSHAKFEDAPEMRPAERHAYYFGTCTLIISTWFICSYLGATLGARLPASVPIDFALPIAFLSMIAPMIRSLPHLAAALTAIVVSLLCIAVPYSLGLIIAGVAGMAAGARTELRMERQREAQQ